MYRNANWVQNVSRDQLIRIGKKWKRNKNSIEKGFTNEGPPQKKLKNWIGWKYLDSPIMVSRTIK